MEAINLRNLPKDGDEDVVDPGHQSIIISTVENGFKVVFINDDTEEEYVYVIDRDESSMITDIIDTLGIGHHVKVR